MACYSPLKIKKIGVNLETGKDKYSITKYRNGDDLTGFSLVPCGSCIGCRIDYAKQWADRCMLEAKYHDENYFLTLTYDNNHLDTITRHYTDSKTGEYCTMLSLNKRDVQLFFKRMRKAGLQFRYYCVGEYGEKELKYYDLYPPRLIQIALARRNRLNLRLRINYLLNSVYDEMSEIFYDVFFSSSTSSTVILVK